MNRPPIAPTLTDRRAFTLVELLIVMAIILVLAGIVVGVQRGVYQKQSMARAEADVQAIATALESYKLRYGDYPWLGDGSNGVELYQHLTGAKKMVPGRSGPTMVTVPEENRVPFIDASSLLENTAQTAFIDPWGQPYEYYYRGSGGAWNYPGFILMSKGPDGLTNSASNFSSGSLNANHFDSEEGADDLIHGFQY